MTDNHQSFHRFKFEDHLNEYFAGAYAHGVIKHRQEHMQINLKAMFICFLFGCKRV